jgi:hypothetical protein
MPTLSLPKGEDQEFAYFQINLIACPAVAEPVEAPKGENMEMWGFICTFTNCISSNLSNSLP